MPAESKLTDPSSWGLSDFFSTYRKRAKNIQLNLSLVKDRWRKCLVEKVGIFCVGIAILFCGCFACIYHWRSCFYMNVRELKAESKEISSVTLEEFSRKSSFDR